MPLEIVTGRSKSGKSEYIYKRISSLVSQGEEVMLIVPEQFSHQAEKCLLGYIDAITDGQAEVFSFNHLADVTGWRLGIPDIARINSVGKAVIIRNVLKENTFSFYTNAGIQRGFADLVSSAIGEFKKYSVLPQTLNSLASKTDDEILSMKLKDLEIMYSGYEQAIANTYRDTDDLLTILNKQLMTSDIYDKKHIFFDAFSTFVPQELEVIATLCKRCKEVCVSLCLDENEINTTLFMPTLNTAKALERAYGKSAKYTHLQDSFFKAEELGFLERKLYTFPLEEYKSQTENIKVYSLSNPLSEVEVCAANIISLIRDKGYKFRDIGVLCSDISSYARHIERIFDFSEIKYFMDYKDDIINHHLIKFVLGLLEIYINDYSYSSIFNYLKTSFVDADASSIAILEHFIKKSNIKRSAWLNDERWTALLNANFPEDLTTQNALSKIRTDCILPLARMHEQLKGRNTVYDNAKVFYKFIKDIKMPDTISGYIRKFENEGETRLAKEYERIWDIIVSTLDEIVHICRDTKVNVSEFHDLLLTAFSQHKVGFIPASVDRVLVGNTERTRFEDIKVLFVLGVNEGVFPVASKPDGVLGDSDKEKMLNLGVEFSTTSSVGAYYSQFCAYRAFTMPSQMLFISYSKADNDFATLRKSYIIDRILKMFSIKEIAETSLNDRERIVNINSSKELLAEKVAIYINNTDIDPVWRSLYDYFKKNTDFTDTLLKFLNSDNFVNSISQENLKKLVPMLSYTSVSKIERYMACKYAYFIDYILRIRPLKETNVDALDIGNITHSILEALCKEFGTSKSAFEHTDDKVIYERIDNLIKEYTDSITKSSDEFPKRDLYILKRLRSSIFVCFSAVKNQFVNSGFEPLGYEIAFNSESEMGAIDMETPNKNHVQLTGKIDRADICKDGEDVYVRVVDYKTGNKEFKLDDVFYALSVQLMVYLNKLVSSNPAYTYGGAFYFPVADVVIKKDGHLKDSTPKDELEKQFKLKGIAPYDENILNKFDETLRDSLIRTKKDKRISTEDFETIHRYLNNKIGCICDEMFKGNFKIEPSKKKEYTPCDYCDYNTICRFDITDTDNSYSYYKPISDYTEVIKEMEACVRGNKENIMDRESANGD